MNRDSNQVSDYATPTKKRKIITWPTELKPFRFERDRSGICNEFMPGVVQNWTRLLLVKKCCTGNHPMKQLVIRSVVTDRLRGTGTTSGPRYWQVPTRTGGASLRWLPPPCRSKWDSWSRSTATPTSTLINSTTLKRMVSVKLRKHTHAQHQWVSQLVYSWQYP